jgi:broad specificity phosphatase PhoE
MARLLYALVFLLAVPGPVLAQAGLVPVPGDTSTTIVILVRHAEKASETETDPALSAAGKARAKALAEALADAGVGAVVVTQRRRTGDTAALLTAARGLVPDTVPIGGPVPAHAAAVAARLRERHLGGTVLVVGHSNTIPPILAALGGPELPDLCDGSYDQLFILVLRNGAAPALTRARFGAASPAGGEACTGMQAR